jgi:hypothetical protein
MGQMYQNSDLYVDFGGTAQGPFPTIPDNSGILL